MNEEEFLKEFGEFQNLFDIIEEPTNSKEQLLKFEEKYCSSHGMVDSQMVYWYYKIQDFKTLRDFIPEVDDWVYYYESFLRYGGNLNELKKPDDKQGQAHKDQKTSDSVDSLVFFGGKSIWN